MSSSLHSVWVPTYNGPYPPCYSGSALEIVQDLMQEVSREEMDTEEAIRCLEYDVCIALGVDPQALQELPLDQQAETLLQIMLDTGLIKKTPDA